jgi:tRNA-binding protein
VAELAATPAKPEIGAEGFAALDLRIAVVLEVMSAPKALRPAWRLVLDGGPALGRLQSSAQITNYPADSLRGRRVVVAVNLGSRRVAGWRSDVLVLGGLAPDGEVRLLGVDGDLPPGSPVA